MIPVGDWVENRLKNLSENDKKRFESRSKSGVDIVPEYYEMVESELKEYEYLSAFARIIVHARG